MATKSDLLSNAATTTAVDGNSIIPIASKAGQPTKNVTLSKLAEVVGGLLPVATSENSGLMSKSMYDHVFPLIGIGTVDRSDDFVRIKFRGKWSALVGFMMNANSSCGLIYIANGSINKPPLRTRKISVDTFGPVRFYYKTDDISDIIIEYMGVWSEVSAVMLTGGIDRFELVKNGNISLSDYTMISF